MTCSAENVNTALDNDVISKKKRYNLEMVKATVKIMTRTLASEWILSQRCCTTDNR